MDRHHDQLLSLEPQAGGGGDDWRWSARRVYGEQIDVKDGDVRTCTRPIKKAGIATQQGVKQG